MKLTLKTLTLLLLVGTASNVLAEVATTQSPASQIDIAWWLQQAKKLYGNQPAEAPTASTSTAGTEAHPWSLATILDALRKVNGQDTTLPAGHTERTATTTPADSKWGVLALSQKLKSWLDQVQSTASTAQDTVTKANETKDTLTSLTDALKSLGLGDMLGTTPAPAK